MSYFVLSRWERESIGLGVGSCGTTHRWIVGKYHSESWGSVCKPKEDGPLQKLVVVLFIKATWLVAKVVVKYAPH